jgi:methyl-accepting chemotaxis protein
MATSKEQSKSVVEGTRAAQTTLETISLSINKISDRSTQIATAATQQQQVTEEMARSINAISDMSSSNTQSTQETVGALQELTVMANDLKSVVSKFNYKQLVILNNAPLENKKREALASLFLLLPFYVCPSNVGSRV